jgi:hypothetical protein
MFPFGADGCKHSYRVIATATPTKVQPGPELRLIGSIADSDAILRHLQLDHLAA